MLPPRAASSTIRTERLTLRVPSPQDIDALQLRLGDYDVVRWLGRMPFPFDAKAARSFVTWAAEGPEAGRILSIDDADGLVGGIAFADELSFWIARHAWGRGYATEAGDAALDLHFAKRRAGPLAAAHHLDNERSARVLEKLGFRPEAHGSLPAEVLRQNRPGRRMVITRADWRPRRRFRLATPRLRLRELRLRDFPALARLRNDAGLAQGILPEPGADATRWFAARAYRGRPGFLAVITTTMGRAIGAVSLSEGSGAGSHILNGVISPDMRGRGLATEAMRAFLADAIPRFGLVELTTAASPENSAVAGLLTGAGFRLEDRNGAMAAVRLEPGSDVLYRLSTREQAATGANP